MQQTTVTLTHVCKNFGSNKAIKDLSFQLQKGKIMGVVGPDGAGKTTLCRLLLGLLVPTSGQISVLGLDTRTQSDELHQLVGYMPQKFGLYEDLTVQENLNLYADLKNLSHPEETFKKLLALTGLSPFTNRLAGRLSGGMKQKLGLACALLGTPQVLVLDEPGVGVDPISRRELMRLVCDLSKNGMSILWSTSYLDEAAHFDNVLLLDEGKLLYNGRPEELTRQMKNNVFLMKKKGISARALLREVLKGKNPVTDAVIQGDAVRIVTSDKKTQKAFQSFLTPVQPRFEDAVIGVLGGAPMGESKVAGQIKVKNTTHFIIEAEHLTKKYGTFTAAEDITFKIPKGEIFGLLGPNGAGKSTSFKMMCGLSKPTSGRAFINGVDMRLHPEKARERLGYMAQKFSLFSPLTVIQNLHFFSGIYGLKSNSQEKRIQEMIDVFKLEPYLTSRAGDLPLGFKQRLALACAIMHNPSILFLDEPTSGVDPLTRREFWKHINAMVEKGVTVMVTTHFMDEAEYCDRIALIYQGKAIKIGTPVEIKKTNETMEDAFIRTILEYNKRSQI